MSFRTFEPTQTQLRMYESPGDGANLAAVFELHPRYDEGRLASAVAEVVARCATFSHRVMRIDGAWRIVSGHQDCPGLTVIDATAGETAFDTLIHGVVGRQFRLDGGAPYLFCLLKTRRTDVLVFVCHPALLDRFSLQPLFAALSAAYAGEPGTGELGLDQEDLVRSERELLSGDRFAEMVRFWLQLGKDTSFEWHPPRLEADMADSSFDLALAPAQAATLAALADRVGIRTGELLLFCAHLLLSKLTGSETVMTSTTHRIRTGGPGTIGFNENKPAFKSELRPDCTVGRYLRLASRLLAMGRSHSDIPAREIAREIARKEPQFKRVTNVLITEDPLPYGDLVLDGAPATLLARFSRRLEVEDIAIHVSTRDGVWFHAMARSAQEASGLRLAFEHFIALLGHVGEDLDKPISALRCFDDALTERALALAQGAPLSEPPDDVMVRFHATAARSPDAPAVRFCDRRLSYAELQRSALAVASRLRPHLAGRSEPLVGICLPRSEGVAQAILGVLEAGGAYVPLDPQMPAERLSFVVADAGVAAVIVDAETRAAFGGAGSPPLLLLADLLDADPASAPAAPPPADRAAYVIYTSGTTGKPKGVVVE
ncbi:MAG: AMP-binding protein, partial [Candidatus Sericytochromatia bacterium]|nr:AMP-binding protein [Candidatus Tanganyikabacteria bacterium]